MKTIKEFLEESELFEHVISIGIKPEHEKFRSQFADQIHDIIQKSYSHPDIGGYGGITSGSKEESDAIYSDISKSLIKVVHRKGKVTAVNLYRDQHGRKSIASGTDGSTQGKKDWLKIKEEDHQNKRSWGEVSGKAYNLQKKLGVPTIPVGDVPNLIKKKIYPTGDGDSYQRVIGNEMHTKVAVGHPKIS